MGLVRTTLARATRPVVFSERPTQRGISTVAKWIEEIKTRPPQVLKDIIQRERAEQLLRTLPTRSMSAGSATAKDGEILPKAYHMAYWNPTDWFEELAADGTATEYNAPEPYTRRMWAGGSYEWAQGGLTIGNTASCSVSVKNAEEKGDKMFVYQQREIFDSVEPSGTPVIREERTHVFFKDMADAPKDSNKPKKKPSVTAMPEPDYQQKYTPTSPLLFRYSAVTWNAHKIHYDKVWTQTVEGHPDLVVQGPLTSTLLVELAERAAEDAGVRLACFDYRATSPMYVDKEIKLNAKWKGPRGKDLELWAEQDGAVGMKGTATMASD